jgi:hypothetical protein
VTLGAGKTRLSFEELAATIRHSGLATLVVEGDDDHFLFRRFEEDFGHSDLSVLIAYEKYTVLELFKVRGTFPVKTAFLVDQDMWCYSGIPEEYRCESLICTDGYSIENDLYRDGQMYNLLLPGERDNFCKDVEEYLRWYAFAVGERLCGTDARIDLHPDHVMPHGVLNEVLMREIAFCEPEAGLYARIRSEYGRLLRGKSLIALLLRHVSRAGRPAKHQRVALLESAFIHGGPHLSAIRDRVGGLFAP